MVQLGLRSAAQSTRWWRVTAKILKKLASPFVEQLAATFLLRVGRILDLDPCSRPANSSIGAERWFADNPFQVHLADLFVESLTSPDDVIDEDCSARIVFHAVP